MGFICSDSICIDSIVWMVCGYYIVLVRSVLAFNWYYLHWQCSYAHISISTIRSNICNWHIVNRVEAWWFYLGSIPSFNSLFKCIIKQSDALVLDGSYRICVIIESTTLGPLQIKGLEGLFNRITEF